MAGESSAPFPTACLPAPLSPNFPTYHRRTFSHTFAHACGSLHLPWPHAPPFCCNYLLLQLCIGHNPTTSPHACYCCFTFLSLCYLLAHTFLHAPLPHALLLWDLPPPPFLPTNYHHPGAFVQHCHCMCCCLPPTPSTSTYSLPPPLPTMWFFCLAFYYAFPPSDLIWWQHSCLPVCVGHLPFHAFPARQFVCLSATASTPCPLQVYPPAPPSHPALGPLLLLPLSHLTLLPSPLASPPPCPSPHGLLPRVPPITTGTVHTHYYLPPTLCLGFCGGQLPCFYCACIITFEPSHPFPLPCYP